MPATDAPERCTATRRPAAIDTRLRPIAHPAPPALWVNDPNGPIHHDGRYHLFYQHNPRAARFDPHMHWGHLSSVDLARWRHHPLALAPEAEGPDAGGCWSGCIVRDDDRAHLLYSTQEQSLCRATTDDDLLEGWIKDPANPLITPQANPTGSPHHRDPCVFRHDGAWLMVLAGQRAGRGALELWRSDDLAQWTHVGCALHDDGTLPLAVDHGELWECPALFALDGRWVLILSCPGWSRGVRRTIAYVGDFDGERYHPGHGRVFDHGLGNCFAGITCQDARGRRLLWSWHVDAGGHCEAWGWHGALSWPLELRVVDGELRAAIPDDLALLRAPDSHRTLIPEQPVRAASADIVLRFQAPGRFPVGVDLMGDADGRALRIRVDPVARCLVLDRSELGTWNEQNDTQRPRYLAPLDADDLADCRLRVVVDRSLVHVHCNDRVRISARAYPADGADRIALVGAATTADCWDLESCILDPE